MNEHDEYIKLQAKYGSLNSEYKNYKSWHNEFFDRINDANSDLVNKIMNEMGGDEKSEN